MPASRKHTTENGLTLRQWVTLMEQLAPPAGAADWDNTGLLWAPTRPRRIRRLLLTIDCTPAVAAEALRRRMDAIVAYHPPLFSPLTRLDPQEPLHRRLLQLIEARVAVYSPHTALDAAPDGVNDWLAKQVHGEQPATVHALPDSVVRMVQFKTTEPFNELASRVQARLKVPYLRLAMPAKRPRAVRHVAVCAGAGAGELAHVPADVWLTGEMKHHDLLAAQARGITVILAEHSHTERGYLPVLRRRLQNRTGPACSIQLARHDRDPVTLYP